MKQVHALDQSMDDTSIFYVRAKGNRILDGFKDFKRAREYAIRYLHRPTVRVKELTITDYALGRINAIGSVMVDPRINGKRFIGTFFVTESEEADTEVMPMNSDGSFKTRMYVWEYRPDGKSCYVAISTPSRFMRI